MTPSLIIIASRIRLKQLRLLIAIEKYGSLHKAAESVGLTQPGATKALQEIESLLNTPLFERTTKGLEANDLGHCVIRYAKLIHSDLAHMREEIDGLLRGEGGQVSVGTVMGAIPHLCKAVMRLRAHHPKISIEIFEDTSHRLLGLLDEGRLHMAVCRPGLGIRPEAYKSYAVRLENVAIVANPRHPMLPASQLELKELAEYQWVVYPADMPMRVLLEREFETAGAEFPRHLIETASTFTALMLMQENPSLVSVLPKDVIAAIAHSGMVTTLPVRLRSNTLCEPYGVISRADTVLPAAAEMLLEELMREIA